MKVLDNIWGILVTVIVYAILFVFSYQVITNEQLINSALFAGCLTPILRFAMAFILQNTEVDFKIYREAITIVLLLIATILWYPK